MAFVATLGSSDATSYVTVAEADAIWANTLNDADWVALTTAQKESSLMASTQALEVLTFLGDRCSPATNDAAKQQRLQWPRSEGTCKGITSACSAIPLQVQQACSYLALSLFNDPAAIIPGVPGIAPETGPIKKQKLGEMEQEYFSPADMGQKVDVSAPIVLQKFPWLTDVLSCWLSGTYGSSKILLRVRS